MEQKRNGNGVFIFSFCSHEYNTMPQTAVWFINFSIFLSCSGAYGSVTGYIWCGNLDSVPQTKEQRYVCYSIVIPYIDIISYLYNYVYTQSL